LTEILVAYVGAIPDDAVLLLETRADQNFAYGAEPLTATRSEQSYIAILFAYGRMALYWSRTYTIGELGKTAKSMHYE
jgi:hypothetical protein